MPPQKLRKCSNLASSAEEEDEAAVNVAVNTAPAVGLATALGAASEEGASSEEEGAGTAAAA